MPVQFLCVHVVRIVVISVATASRRTRAELLTTTVEECDNVATVSCGHTSQNLLKGVHAGPIQHYLRVVVHDAVAGVVHKQ